MWNWVLSRSWICCDRHGKVPGSANGQTRCFPPRRHENIKAITPAGDVIGLPGGFPRQVCTEGTLVRDISEAWHIDPVTLREVALDPETLENALASDVTLLERVRYLALLKARARRSRKGLRALEDSTRLGGTAAGPCPGLPASVPLA